MAIKRTGSAATARRPKAAGASAARSKKARKPAKPDVLTQIGNEISSQWNDLTKSVEKLEKPALRELENARKSIMNLASYLQKQAKKL